MMKWIDQRLFDDLILTNSYRAEQSIQDMQPLLKEVLPFIPDAELQYRVYHDDTEHTNTLQDVKVCFRRQDILFSISKQTYPKTTYHIHCCNVDDLPHVDNYSRTKALEGLREPQRIGKLSKRKIEEWADYRMQYYRNLARIDEENKLRIREHIARLEQIPDVQWSRDRQSGTIERRGICYAFHVEGTSVAEYIRLSCCAQSLDVFLNMARPYEPVADDAASMQFNS